MIEDSAIRTAILTIVKSIATQANVWRRIRYNPTGNQAVWNEIYIGADNNVHAYFLRRVQRRTYQTGLQGRVLKREHTYTLIGFYGVTNSESDTTASEDLFNAEIDALGELFETPPFDLGLGVAVKITGLQMPTDFADVKKGNILAHCATLRITVTVANTGN